MNISVRTNVVKNITVRFFVLCKFSHRRIELFRLSFSEVSAYLNYVENGILWFDLPSFLRFGVGPEFCLFNDFDDYLKEFLNSHA